MYWFKKTKGFCAPREAWPEFGKFLQDLRRIRKDGNFQVAIWQCRPRTKEQRRNCFLRDTFINSIFSTAIRQRLLKGATLKIGKPFEKAHSLRQPKRTLKNPVTLLKLYLVFAACNSFDVKPKNSVCAVPTHCTWCFFWSSKRRHTSSTEYEVS